MVGGRGWCHSSPPPNFCYNSIPDSTQMLGLVIQMHTNDILRGSIQETSKFRGVVVVGWCDKRGRCSLAGVVRCSLLVESKINTVEFM